MIFHGSQISFNIKWLKLKISELYNRHCVIVGILYNTSVKYTLKLKLEFGNL